MKRFLLFFIIISAFQASAQNQRCRQLSMKHFGGNKTDLLRPLTRTHADGSFTLALDTGSDSGDIHTGCPAGYGGTGLFYTYNEAYTDVIAIDCAPRGDDFLYYTFDVFPQANGDVVYFGIDRVSDPDADIGAERRDAAGNLIWKKHYGGSQADYYLAGRQAADGSFYIVGATTSADGDVGSQVDDSTTGPFSAGDIWAFRLSNDGDLLWSRTLGSTGYDEPYGIALSDAGGCYVLGAISRADNDGVGSHGGSEVLVVKLDTAGHTGWARCYGGSGIDDFACAPIKDSADGLYILGRTGSMDGDVQRRMPIELDYWLFHIDSAGTLLWENTFGGPGWQAPLAFCRSADGSFWMGGSTSGLAGGNIDMAYGGSGGDGWVAHADSGGSFLNQIVLGADREERIDMLYPLSDGTVLAGGRYYENVTPGSGSPGFPYTSGGWDDIFIARLGPNSVGITEQAPASGAWEMRPNPAGARLRISIPDRADGGEYRLGIYDALGKTVYRKSFRRMLEIDTRAWAAGSYMVTLEDAAGRKSSRKLVLDGH